MVYAMVTVDVGEVRGDLATCEPSGQRCFEVDIGASPHLRWGPCRCLTTDSLPWGYPGQYVRASAYVELDDERKRQSIYPGSGP